MIEKITKLLMILLLPLLIFEVIYFGVIILITPQPKRTYRMLKKYVELWIEDIKNQYRRSNGR